MTLALEKASGTQCQILVKKESWAMPWQDECEALSLQEKCWIREVIMMTDQPVIFARSVFPQKLIEHFPNLTMLGSTPLGKILFSDNTFQRGDIEVAEISAGKTQKYWARRSLFHSTISPFLLTEVFFPYVATL